MKKKIFKAQVAHSYDKDLKKNLPVYIDFWEQADGTYKAELRGFVNEVEIPDKKPESQKPSL